MKSIDILRNHEIISCYNFTNFFCAEKSIYTCTYLNTIRSLHLWHHLRFELMICSWGGYRMRIWIWIKLWIILLLWLHQIFSTFKGCLPLFFCSVAWLTNPFLMTIFRRFLSRCIGRFSGLKIIKKIYCKTFFVFKELRALFCES